MISYSWIDVLDEGITKGGTNWQLYGSKKPGNQPYKLSYVYDVCIDDSDNELMYNPVDIRSFVNADSIIKLSARNRDSTFLFMDNNFTDEYDAVNNTDKQHLKSNTSISRTNAAGALVTPSKACVTTTVASAFGAGTSSCNKYLLTP